MKNRQIVTAAELLDMETQMQAMGRRLKDADVGDSYLHSYLGMVISSLHSAAGEAALQERK